MREIPHDVFSFHVYNTGVSSYADNKEVKEEGLEDLRRVKKV